MLSSQNVHALCGGGGRACEITDALLNAWPASVCGRDEIILMDASQNNSPNVLRSHALAGECRRSKCEQCMYW